MTPSQEPRLTTDLHEVASRLQRERPEATALELDRMKLLAMNRVARPNSPRRARTVRSRLVSPVLAAALLIGGVAALAGTTSGPPISAGGSNASSSNSMYCPASSPAADQPKKQPGGNKCGQ